MKGKAKQFFQLSDKMKKDGLIAASATSMARPWYASNHIIIMQEVFCLLDWIRTFYIIFYICLNKGPFRAIGAHSICLMYNILQRTSLSNE